MCIIKNIFCFDFQPSNLIMESTISKQYATLDRFHNYFHNFISMDAEGLTPLLAEMQI